MARGWESKSIEAQQDEAATSAPSDRSRLTQEEANRSRQKEILRLSLQSILQQIERSQEPRHRAMLEKARADVARKIQDLDS